ncbi:MAG: anion transporter, partial [Phycisphaerae bacterium]|nr:anion transporter [Phycisphaerae bacterium]
MNHFILAAIHVLSSPDTIIFALTYVGLTLGTIPGTRLDRSSIAMLGAIAVLLLHRMRFSTAMAQIDFGTLALLLSLMVISAQLRLAGFYHFVVKKIVSAADLPWILLLAVMGTAALLSALFANDVICLIFAPVIVVAFKRAGRDPIPYLMALATAANIGSAATIIGNPQNMLIGESGHLSFAGYTLAVFPLIFACLILNVLGVALVYRKRIFSPAKITSSGTLGTAPAMDDPPEAPDPQMQAPAVQWGMVVKCLVIMALLLVALIFGKSFSIPRPIAALAAAGLVLVSRRTRPRDLFAMVDWNLILLFVGLFVVIGNAQAHELLQPMMHTLKTHGVNLQSRGPLAAVTLVLSNLVSNVPAVLLLKPAIPLHATTLWYLLAVVSTVAGNLTLLG